MCLLSQRPSPPLPSLDAFPRVEGQKEPPETPWKLEGGLNHGPPVVVGVA